MMIYTEYSGEIGSWDEFYIRPVHTIIHPSRGTIGGGTLSSLTPPMEPQEQPQASLHRTIGPRGQRFVAKLVRKPYLFRRITTFTVEEWRDLAKRIAPEWNRRERERLTERTDRIRAIGQGRKYEIGPFPNLLLATLLYLRTTMGYALLGLLLDVDGETVRRAVSRVLPLLEDRFIPKTDLTKRKRRSNSIDDLLTDFPGLEEVIFDGTEVPVQRPKRRQRRAYSGKKKRHTVKAQIAIGRGKGRKRHLIVGVSPPAPGAIHDKPQLERTGWDRKLSPDVLRRGDLGYQGMPGWVLPHKKPRGGVLTTAQRRENKRISRKRIIVEHTIRTVKVFRRIGELVTIKANGRLSAALLAAANLANYKVLVRQGA